MQAHCRRIAFAALVIVVSMSAADVNAQQPQTVRIRGTIAAVDGQKLAIKSREGADLSVTLADNARVMAFVKAAITDIKPGAYIGVAAMPQSDGSQRAFSIHIFPEAMRGTGEGFRGWDARPESTMTNAAVESTVTSNDGNVLMLKYKDGEKKIVVPGDTPIVTYAPADRSELKPGASIIIMGARKETDGALIAPSINVGRGIAPPM